MKKKIMIMLTAFAFAFTSSFANTSNDKIPANISADFSHHFSKATNVSWDKTSNYYKVSFNMAGTTLLAYYSSDAHLIGIAHPILSDKLPMMLQMNLRINYPGYWITDLYEYALNHDPGYVITLENADQKVVLRSDDLSNWHIANRVKKED